MTPDRWKYFFDECALSDKTLLYKLAQEKPARRWVDFVKKFNLQTTPVSNPDALGLLKVSGEGNVAAVKAGASAKANAAPD